MNPQAQQLIDRIKQAQNILVTVSSSPSVDQLAAAIGLTVALNKMNKHGTAVFSGDVPSTIEFLKPEATLERNTDSLRDFIIALDKSKADKLRYKVEDQVVRIFITPYRTSLSQDDLEFSQGDFNVDVVVALGVSDQKDVDTAITAHGRILHDATVASVSITGTGDLGTINWVDTGASSLSEMALGLIDGLDKKLLDNQIATALLTGIVANTDRFRNEKTSPKAMSASAELMAAGANQQLIATELETVPTGPEPNQNEGSPEKVSDKASTRQGEPGELDIVHDQSELPPPKPENTAVSTPTDSTKTSAVVEPKTPEPSQPQIHVDEDGKLTAAVSEPPLPTISHVHGVESDEIGGEHPMPEIHRERMTAPPSLGDVNLTANTAPEGFEPPAEELTLPAVSSPLLTHNETVLSQVPPPPSPHDESPFIPQAPMQPAPSTWVPPKPPAPVPAPPLPAPSPVAAPLTPSNSVYSDSSQVGPLAPMPAPPAGVAAARVAPPISPASASLMPNETLEEIEEAVRSPHLQKQPAPATPDTNVDDARSAVQAAFSNASAPPAPSPIAALNAQPLGPELHQPASPAPIVPNTGFNEPTPGNTPADATLDMPLPSNPFGPGKQAPLPGGPAGTSPQSGSVPPVPPPFVPPVA